jgi:hypothetical protein
MEGLWPIIFLAVILKIPILAGMYLVYYAVKAVPEVEEDEAPPNENDHGFRRWRREPVRPRGPRRDPHGGAQHASPECSPGRGSGRARTRAIARRAPAHD